MERKQIIILFLVVNFYSNNGLAKKFNRSNQVLHETHRSANTNLKWTQVDSNHEVNIKNLIYFLSKSDTGQKLLLKAQQRAAKIGETLLDVIHAGNGSLTDTTLIRKFLANNPLHVIYESKSKIYINSNLTIIDAVLDLAHELTHFAYRGHFNPYSKNFSLDHFIESTVEGVGGEVDAYITECKVLSEVFKQNQQNRYHCRRILNDNGEGLSFQRAKEEFYKVGRYYDKFKAKLKNLGVKKISPFLSDKEPIFISSAYGRPYPIAALEEYLSVMGHVCENDKKRLEYINLESSQNDQSIEKYRNQLKLFKSRCTELL